MPTPAQFKSKKHWMQKCLHQVLHREKKDESQGLAQCLNMWRKEHGGKPAPKKCVAELLETAAQSLNKTAGYPDHPDDVVISKGELWGGSHPVTELDVYNYYSGVKAKMIPDLKGRNLFIAIKPKGVLRKGQKPIYVRHPYHGNTEYIRISNDKDFETYHSGRTVEIHTTQFQMAPYYIVDFDAPGPFLQTKKITALVADELKKLPEVKKVELHYTGKRGFHIFGWLKKARDVDEAREFLKEWLKEKFGDRDDVVIGESPKGNKGALGLSPMKVNGGHVALWSLRVTGLCCVEVPRASLMSFEREDAAIDKVYKKATGRAFKFGQETKKSASRVIESFLNREAVPWIGGNNDLFFEELSERDKRRVVRDLNLGKEIYLPEYKDNPEKTVSRLDLDPKDYDVLNKFPWYRKSNPNPRFKYENQHYVETGSKIAGYDREKIKPGYTGTFVVHDHFAEKAGHHWDLRISFPVTSLAKALGHYNHKRSEKSSEPGNDYPDKPGTVYRSFAIRKHKIPTGETKLFIVETEDHPIPYGTFHGKIPEGEYGAGTVSIWDHGTYEMVSVKGDSRYVIDFHGKKLNGQYALVKYGKGYLWVKVKEKKASAIDYPRATLPDHIWDNTKIPPKLKGSIRADIMSGLVSAFEKAKMTEPLKWITSLTISGSSAGYNYRDDSDFDVDICYDSNALKSANLALDKMPPEAIIKSIRNIVGEINKTYVPGTRTYHSYMVLEEGDRPSGDGLYDVIADKWIKVPHPVPINFDPEEAFVVQKRKALDIIAEADVLIRSIVATTEDLELAQESHREPRRVILMNRLKQLCMAISDLHDFIWKLQDDAKDPQLPHYYPAFDFSANWDERMLIFKYIARYGYHVPIHMLYARLKDSPLLKLVDKYIPD